MSSARRPPQQTDDGPAARDILRRAIYVVIYGFLATLLFGAGITVYVALTGRAAAEPRIEVLGGACNQTRSEKGSWWNDHYPTSIDLSTSCSQIGVSATPWKLLAFGTPWDAGWRLAYVNLGRITTDSVMALRDDEQFANPSGAHCDHATNSGCLIRTVGGGTAQGISAGLLMERDLAGFQFARPQRNGIVFGVEGGLFVYHNRFTIDITRYPDPGGAPAIHWDEAEGWLATTYVGANLRFLQLMVSARAYQRVTAHAVGCGGCSGITKGPAYQVVAGFSIPF